MTAIFAYASGDVAFMASDTKRDICGHTTVACKTHRWNENIIISQTGFGEGLQRLVGEMLSWQHRDKLMMTGAGVLHAFKQLAAVRLAAEVSMLKRPTLGQKDVNGTLLVAEAGRNGVPANIFTLDWITEAHAPQSGPVYADGTDQPGFLTIAQTEFAAMGSGGSGFDLAAWGISCIGKAKLQPVGAAVDWPADLTICRTDHGVPVTLAQRVAGPSSPTHPMFIL